jgi:hypothetical protein
MNFKQTPGFNIVSLSSKIDNNRFPIAALTIKIGET